jgi:hypothetical protein
MIQINRLPITPDAAARIKRWLGAEGAREFMDWLVSLNAVLTAEAGNLLEQAGENASNADEARAKAEEGAEIRRFINRINEARESDFQFVRCELSPATVSVITQPKS